MKSIIQMLGVLFITIALLIGCGDKKEDLVKEFEQHKVTTTYKFYDNSKEVTKAYREWMGKDLHTDPFGNAKRDGFATWDQYNKTCVVHTMRVRHVEDKERLELLGHEVLHCMYGRYHK